MIKIYDRLLIFLFIIIISMFSFINAYAVVNSDLFPNLSMPSEMEFYGMGNNNTYTWQSKAFQSDYGLDGSSDVKYYYIYSPVYNDNNGFSVVTRLPQFISINTNVSFTYVLCSTNNLVFNSTLVGLGSSYHEALTNYVTPIVNVNTIKQYNTEGLDFSMCYAYSANFNTGNMQGSYLNLRFTGSGSLYNLAFMGYYLDVNGLDYSSYFDNVNSSINNSTYIITNNNNNNTNIITNNNNNNTNNILNSIDEVGDQVSQMGEDISTSIKDNFNSCEISYNLFDKNNVNILNGLIGQNSSILASGNKERSFYLSIDPNTTYTISKNRTSRFRVTSVTDIPYLNMNLPNERIINDNSSSITYTTSSNSNYLLVSFYFLDSDTSSFEDILGSIQVVKGSSVLPYKPYGEICSNKIDDTNSKIDDLNKNLTDDNVDDSSASGFFNNFDDEDNGGISGVITAPLRAIQNVNNTCQPLTLTLFNQNIELPCGDTLFWGRSDVSSFRLFWNMLFGGLIIYRLVLYVFKIIEGIKDPNYDKVEFIKL